MEGSCSTGQSPQWAVVPVEEEEHKEINIAKLSNCRMGKLSNVSISTHHFLLRKQCKFWGCTWPYTSGLLCWHRGLWIILTKSSWKDKALEFHSREFYINVKEKWKLCSVLLSFSFWFPQQCGLPWVWTLHSNDALITACQDELQLV
jgi:hypothetical protein